MKQRIYKYLAIPLAFTLAGCGKAANTAPAESADAETPVAENIPVKMDPVFRSSTAQIDVTEMEALGFVFGDSLTLSFSNDLILDDIPYHDGYYVKPNHTVAVAYPGLYGVNIALNLGEGSWDYYGFEEGVTVTIRLKEHGKYLNEQKTFAQSHSDEISDYDSPEQFANWRSLAGGNVVPDLIYRSATMTNNTMNRADVVDDLAEQYGIKTVLDLSDTNEALGEYRSLASWNSDYFDALYESGAVDVVGLGVNPGSESFHKELSQALYQMIQRSGPYLFFCTEGKDRTGYCAVLIEALCGATYKELLADYMKTYENYYGMTAEKTPDQCKAAIDNSFDPILEIMFEVQEGEDLKTIDCEERARGFFRAGGLSDEQIDEMRQVFSGRE